MADAALRFEAVDAAASLLARYDRTASAWDIPQRGEFWDIVAQAHARGQNGAGQRIAIIDSAFDLSIAQLAGATMRQRGRFGESSDHGTAVALLVLAVAPVAQLDLYEVAVDGRPDVRAIRVALRAVAQSGVDTVCMSIAVPVARGDLRVLPLDDLAGTGLPAIVDALAASGGRYTVELDACPLSVCLCSEARALGGATIFAASGNDATCLSCPAVAGGVVSTGFQLEARTIVEGDIENAAALPPSYSQAEIVDVLIRQPADVLGSSFATPLAAGLAALGLDRAALPAMLASARLGSYGDLLLARAREGGLDAGVTAQMLGIYDAATRGFGHSGEPGHWCVGCALLGTTLFTNAGLAFYGAGELVRAEGLLRTARQIAPSSADAAANLARALIARLDAGEAGLAAEALALYDHAIALRPGYRGYDRMRAVALLRCQ